jgi:DNA-binding NarL/FixJ family response regulator
MVAKNGGKIARRPWTNADFRFVKRELKARLKTGKSVKDIARALKRSEGALRQKIFAQGIDCWGASATY